VIHHELPLFPLNTVLFPGMPLDLYIFEPRYKLMIAECIRSGDPFGVVLIRAGKEVGGTAEVYDIGTTALITDVKKHPGGEMDIRARGLNRFRLEATHTRRPFLTGVAHEYPLERSNEAELTQAARGLAPIVKDYLNFFAKLGEIDQRIDQLPEDPALLAYLTAFVLHVPMKDKQSILNLPDLMTMIHEEGRILRREAAILRHMVQEGKRWRSDPSLFSPN